MTKLTVTEPLVEKKITVPNTQQSKPNTQYPIAIVKSQNPIAIAILKNPIVLLLLLGIGVTCLFRVDM